jgi:hypothetical protein
MFLDAGQPGLKYPEELYPPPTEFATIFVELIHFDSHGRCSMSRRRFQLRKRLHEFESFKQRYMDEFGHDNFVLDFQATLNLDVYELTYDIWMDMEDRDSIVVTVFPFRDFDLKVVQRFHVGDQVLEEECFVGCMLYDRFKQKLHRKKKDFSGRDDKIYFVDFSATTSRVHRKNGDILTMRESRWYKISSGDHVEIDYTYTDTLNVVQIFNIDGVDESSREINVGVTLDRKGLLVLKDYLKSSKCMPTNLDETGWFQSISFFVGIDFDDHVLDMRSWSKISETGSIRVYYDDFHYH